MVRRRVYAALRQAADRFESNAHIARLLVAVVAVALLLAFPVLLSEREDHPAAAALPLFYLVVGTAAIILFLPTGRRSRLALVVLVLWLIVGWLGSIYYSLKSPLESPDDHMPPLALPPPLIHPMSA